MSVPYFLRLVCLCSACFFLLHLGFAAAAAAAGRWAVRRAEGMAPVSGARLLLMLRLAPAAAAVLVVTGICAPSYLWLEPEATAEHVGWLFLAAAAMGGWICAAGLARAARAVARSSRYLRNCQAMQESDAPVVLLAGVWRPRLVVSRGVREALEPEQLAAAIRHERAHGASRDNLKRLLLAGAPAAPGLKDLERGWARMAEWVADDRAAQGDAGNAVALAAALVRVARMGAAAAAPALATSLMADAGDLETRVERLLNPAAPASASGRRRWWWAAGIALAAAVQPGTLSAAHRVMEQLMR